MRAAYWELHKGGAASTPRIVLGRKFCTSCGRWRPVSDFAVHRDGYLRAHCQACGRADRRRWYVVATVEQRARKNEYERIWWDAKRREAGIPRRRRSGPNAVDRVEWVFLPPEPLMSFVRQFGEDYRTVATRAGITERTLTRYLTGESRHIRLDIADKLAVAIDLPLTLLYGDADVIYAVSYAETTT
jgi:hypothetical protein